MNTPRTQELNINSLLTSYQVGTLLQVNPSSVNKWVKDGRMPAFRTPGGHRRIRATDLFSFLVAHNMPIPQSLMAAARRRVLIVDSDARYLDHIGHAAQAAVAQAEVMCVDNGVDAMVQVGAFRPHLIVLDAHMPHFDSIEACRRLKNSPQTAFIRVLMACQQPTSEMHQHAVDAGADGCVVKFGDIDALLHELGIQKQAIAS